MRAVRPPEMPVLDEAQAGAPSSPTFSNRSVRTGLAGMMVAAGLGASPAFVTEVPKLRILHAWLAAVEQTGGDVPFLMTISNGDTEPDNLLRVNCPFANFSEKHTVDRGEGAPAMRAIRSIPIPGSATTELKADGYHVMLLQIRQKLAPGEKLNCTVTFQRAGRVETEVDVRSSL